MRQPNFNAMRAEYDGFSPEGDKPSKANVKAFVRSIALKLHEARDGELDTWEDVLEMTHDQINFFRVYYCGECPSKVPPFSKFFFPQSDPAAKR